jgi:hypothetical protein
MMGGGGMGGGMMGGMGGGMGGMGGGMMGGMGGGFRSVPPTAAPTAALKPGQTRHLPTRLVSLTAPAAGGRVVLPAKDEPLQIGDVTDLTNDARLGLALTRLAEEKAPETVSQLILWHIGTGLDWNTLARISRKWANDSERALARQFVARLDASSGRLDKEESGRIFVDVTSEAPARAALAADVRELMGKAGLLGLKAESVVPARPTGPALACRVTLTAADEAAVELSITDATGTRWADSGKFTLPIAKELPPVEGKTLTKAEEAQYRAALLSDAVAEGLLSRLVRAQLSKGPKVGGKDTYKIRLDNASPMVLNGIALSGLNAKPEDRPSAVAGFSLPPRKTMTLPATGDMVERLGMKAGIKAIAADLSNL